MTEGLRFTLPQEIVHVSSSGDRKAYVIPGELNQEQMLQLRDYFACKRLTELNPIMEKAGWNRERLSAEDRALIQQELDLFNETGMDGRYAQMAIAGIPMTPPDFFIPVVTR